ncbi:MAG: hypothetical protein NXY57DRAFT_730652 [Lentinula lateritia]|nr:MAG: hypothetical protein NXY57DRAFT_730652 [Lentinula lateritia]
MFFGPVDQQSFLISISSSFGKCFLSLLSFGCFLLYCVVSAPLNHVVIRLHSHDLYIIVIHLFLPPLLSFVNVLPPTRCSAVVLRSLTLHTSLSVLKKIECILVLFHCQCDVAVSTSSHILLALHIVFLSF